MAKKKPVEQETAKEVEAQDQAPKADAQDQAPKVEQETAKEEPKPEPKAATQKGLSAKLGVVLVKPKVNMHTAAGQYIEIDKEVEMPADQVESLLKDERGPLVEVIKKD